MRRFAARVTPKMLPGFFCGLIALRGAKGDGVQNETPTLPDHGLIP